MVEVVAGSETAAARQILHPCVEAPQTADAYSLRGLFYAMKGDYERAISDLDKALQLNPKDKDTYRLKNWATRQKRRKQIAIRRLSK